MHCRTKSHTRASVQLCFADSNDIASVRRCAYYQQGLLQGSFVLVDFPKILLISYFAPLARIQKLVDAADIAFLDHLTSTTTDALQVISPPTYATADGFEYKLGNLQCTKPSGRDMVIRPAQITDDPESKAAMQVTLTALNEQTTLDEGQAQALVESLNRKIALTQGPPGTGKTYLV